MYILMQRLKKTNTKKNFNKTEQFTQKVVC